MPSVRSFLGIALATAPLAFAQTYTDCNPMNKTCTPDTGLAQWTITSDFTKGESEFKKYWTAADGTSMTYDDTKGAVFNISKETDAPTIETDFYIFYGKVDVVMQAAPGTGIISSVVMESDDLDEIDWEWLGGNGTSAETNYFGKGNTTAYDRAIYYSVDEPTSTMHTYTVDWTADYIKWSIDGDVVRTLNYSDALGGYDFPQTPLRIKLGNWDGGASTEAEGTVEWAGGYTDFDNGPFIMYVQSVTITNYNPAKEYNWTTTSGMSDSIQGSNATATSNLQVTSSSGAASATGSSASSGSSSSSSSFSQSSTTSAAATNGLAFSFASVASLFVAFLLI